MTFVSRANWLLLAGPTAAGAIFAPLDFALGIFSGGLIVTVNFYLLARTLHRALKPPHLASHNAVLAKYYLRFIASGFVIFLLIAGGVVNPLGLVIGEDSSRSPAPKPLNHNWFVATQLKCGHTLRTC